MAVEHAGTVGVTPPTRLARGVLTNVDIATSTMANIAPAMSFYFSFALIVEAAGVASPLTVIAAGIAIALLGNTVTQFSRSVPSTGSFVTFIGKGLGPYPAVVAAVVTGCGYIIAVASVVGISGGWTEDLLKTYVHITIPWQLLTVILTGIALAMIVRGAKMSTVAAGVFFAFEFGLLVVVSIVLLAEHSASISSAPFDPSHLHNGFSGLSLGFPAAVYMFIGWENSAALAEESDNPRVGIGRAVFASVSLMVVAYLLFAFSTVTAFNDNVERLVGADVPFVSAAKSVAGWVGFVAYIAGFTSIFGTLLSATNAQARIIFNSGREGLLPSVMGRVTREAKTPYVAFIIFLGLALGITFVFGWNTKPETFFGEAATLGTILVSVVYLVTNLALPVHYWRVHREQFGVLRHVVLPALGVAAIGYPIYQLIKPGQPAPFNRYPLIALIIVVVALVYGAIVYARDRTLGERVGSIVADAD
jgi:amino acid transporter